MNGDLTALAVGNDELRARGTQAIVYDNETFAGEVLAGALLNGRLDDESEFEFSGDLEGRLMLGLGTYTTYIGKAHSYPRYTYARARGGRLGLDHEQATTLIQAHWGRITVLL